MVEMNAGCPEAKRTGPDARGAALGRALRLAARLGICGLLMAWIFHAIFMFEALQVADPAEWAGLSRTARWEFAWTHGPIQLASMLSHVNGGALLGSFLLMGLILLAGVARWRRVLAAGGLPLSWSRAIEISLVAHFFNSFLLGSAGGDVLRAIYAARETHHRKTEAVVTVFVDRILGLWALLLLGCGMMLPNLPLIRAHPQLQLLCLVVLGMTVACTGVVWAALRGGVTRGWGGARGLLRRFPKGPALERSLDACREFGRSPGFAPRVVGLSMVLNALCILQVQVLAWGLGMPLAPVLTALLVPVITAIIAIPVTPSGLGIRENLFVYLLCTPVVGINATSALSLSLLAYAGSLAWSLVGGVVYLTFRRRHHLSEVAVAGARDSEGG
ncbi:MAG TPA: hypothetical protein DCM86_00120 [Verrucomicrobiales bacterium]|nr:hypothetical protein [Verrucomicrobiales bacterium]